MDGQHVVPSGHMHCRDVSCWSHLPVSVCCREYYGALEHLVGTNYAGLQCDTCAANMWLLSGQATCTSSQQHCEPWHLCRTCRDAHTGPHIPRQLWCKPALQNSRARAGWVQPQPAPAVHVPGNGKILAQPSLTPTSCLPPAPGRSQSSLAAQSGAGSPLPR
jgi:hypothetical protein